MAKQRKYKPEVIKKLLDSIKSGNFRITACKIAGISQKTLCEWLRKYPDLKLKIEEAEANVEAECVKIILDKGKTDPKWCAWFIERKFPDRWYVGVYRWELQLVQKQLKEMKEMLNEVQKNKQADSTNEEGNSSGEIEQKDITE